MSSELTASMDVAQVILYAFWIFFFGLIFWLRREDRREGYPLEGDLTQGVLPVNPVLIPPAKTFLLPDGSSVKAPNFERDTREIHAERISGSTGFPSQPIGDPMLSNVGPASYAQRTDKPELTREGHDLIVPMRVATDFSFDAGYDPRGWNVVAADGLVAGVVKDLWVDRADVMVRYLEVELPKAEGADAQRRLLPITMLRILGEPKQVQVVSIKSAHFSSVPQLKNPDRVTILEEERIGAFYAGGRLYADPKRVGPAL